jgi:hypothetical protein
VTIRWVRVVELWLWSALVFAFADLLFSWNPIAAAPYLLHRADPAFRDVPAYAFGLAAELINGAVVALAFLAVERGLHGSPTRRGVLFGSVLWGFWVVSGTMSTYVWMELPVSVAVANILFGLPKSLLIGLGAARFWVWRPARP